MTNIGLARKDIVNSPTQFLLLILMVYHICFSPYLVFAQHSELPWLNNIGAQGKRVDIHTIHAKADVIVSDDLTYKASTVFHDRQRAVFHIEYTDRIAAFGVEGRYIWEYDGKVETEAATFREGIVLGHQFHAQILFFDKIHPDIGKPKKAEFKGKECLSISSESEDSPLTFYYERSGRPLGMIKSLKDEAPIIFWFDDWRTVNGILLPFTVWIDDGKRVFKYQYSTISLNEGSLAEYRAPENVLTEEQKLLRSHRVFMDGHLFGNTSEMKTNRGESLEIVYAGEVYTVTGEENDAQMDRLMGNRNYTVYDDLIRPIVKISEDGTLGWIIVQVSAKGVRLDANGKVTGPLKFVAAWVALYEKVHGKWKLIGNASNIQPGRQ